MDKIYTAFISSTFESLRSERNQVIDTLLDFRVLPIGMEHFTVSSSGNFSELAALIDDSDFFVLLLGRYYGSCDKDGVSWTEHEYKYARKKKKPILAIICDDLISNFDKAPESLSEQEQKQVEFGKRVEFAQKMSPEFGIEKIMRQFFSGYNYSKCAGWRRIDLTDEDLAEWRRKNKAFDLDGTWYHVHLSDEDENYIRIGSLTVHQDFSPNNYKTFTMTGGVNYSIDYYDTEKSEFKKNRMKSSTFTGNYNLGDNGEISGIFKVKRQFNGSFSSFEVHKGERRGIHNFNIDVNVLTQTTTHMDGEFHDEAPSPKMGRIFMFKDESERDRFLLENREDVIEKR